MTTSDLTPDLATAVRWQLLALAKQEDDRAATEAAAVYWSHHPHSIEGHRAAATALRQQADRILNLILSPGPAVTATWPDRRDRVTDRTAVP
jgi:hypothetical protein